MQTHYTGADALTVEQSVAAPIEQQMSGVDNMNYMYSINANSGDIRLIVNFDVATDPNIDQVLTQLRVSQAQSQLPADVNNYGVTVKKSTTAPLMLVSLYSPKGTYDEHFPRELRLHQPGRSTDPRSGNWKRADFRRGPIRDALVGEARPTREAWHHRSRHHHRGAKAEHTVNPAGQVGGEPIPSGQKFTYTVRAQGRLQTPEEFGEIVVRANPDGSFVRVKDIARIDLGAQTYNVRGRLNGQPAAILASVSVARNQCGQSRASSAQADDGSEAAVSRRHRLCVSLDQTLSVTEGISEILKTLLEALALVVLVVFIFLQGWRATLIPLCAVPVSLVGTFVLFPLFGFSINTLSLFGLVLAIGLVVDDAIVVVEAVERHIEEGMAPREATLQAMREVSGPVIGIALVLSAVFIPTAFLPGITGRLYQQFALTIAISVIISAFNALSLSPALSAILLRPRKKTRGPLGWFYDRFNRIFGSATHGYVNWSRVAIRKAVLSFALLLVLAVGAGFLGKDCRAAFCPRKIRATFFSRCNCPTRRRSSAPIRSVIRSKIS